MTDRHPAAGWRLEGTVCRRTCHVHGCVYSVQGMFESHDLLATGSRQEPVTKKSLPQGEKGGKDMGNSENIVKSGIGFAASLVLLTLAPGVTACNCKRVYRVLPTLPSLASGRRH